MPESAEEILNRHLHREDNTFWIPRKGSIRDQIKTAHVFVRAAEKRGIFQLARRHLVLGGGVTGVAVAIKAAQLGVEIVLVEKAEELFPIQSRCSSRYIHPYEYAWPLFPFWPSDERGLFDSYPLLKEDQEACPPGLSWTAGAASEIAKQWRRQLAERWPFRLRFRPNAASVKGKSLRETFDPLGLFGVIVACVGGEERNAVDENEKEAFASFTYWSTDEFENPNLPNKLGLERLKILISGGGDGGLQDFLRLTCRSEEGKLFSAGAILKKLLDQLTKSEAFRESVKRLVHENPENPARPEPRKLWDEHKSLARALTSDTQFCEQLKALLDPLILSRKKQVTLAFQEENFSRCFSLNSLLVHTIACYIDQNNGSVSEESEASLRPNTTIKAKGITSAQENHVCQKDANQCLQASHRVDFGAGQRTYDVIILRHGDVQLGTPPKSPPGP